MSDASPGPKEHDERAKRLIRTGADKLAKTKSMAFQLMELKWYARTKNRWNPRTRKWTLKCGSCNLSRLLLVDLARLLGHYEADATDPELKRWAKKARTTVCYYRDKRLLQSPKADNALSKQEEPEPPLLKLIKEVS